MLSHLPEKYPESSKRISGLEKMIRSYLGLKYSLINKLFISKQSNPPYYNLMCGCMHAKSLQLCPTLCYPMDCSPPGSLSMGFSRQEHWHGLPCPPPGDLPHSGIEPTSLKSLALTGRFFTASAT